MQLGVERGEAGPPLGLPPWVVGRLKAAQLLEDGDKLRLGGGVEGRRGADQGGASLLKPLKQGKQLPQRGGDKAEPGGGKHARLPPGKPLEGGDELADAGRPLDPDRLYDLKLGKGTVPQRGWLGETVRHQNRFLGHTPILRKYFA